MAFSEKVQVQSKLLDIIKEENSEIYQALMREILVQGESSQLEGVKIEELYLEHPKRECYTYWALVRGALKGVDWRGCPDPEYGLGPVWRSTLVPGWGQFYKQHHTKGWLLLASEVVLVPTALYATWKGDDERQKASNARKVYVRKNEAAQADFQLRPLKGIIYGRITDVHTGQPIRGASITTTPTTESKTSDSDGNYTIGPINMDSYTVIVTAADYKDVSKEVHLEPGDRKQVDVQLEPSPSPKVTITRGPEDGATLSTSEITFAWEGNTITYRYRVVNSPYYEDFQETNASSVVLKDLDESPEHTSYTFEIVAVGEDGRESPPDTRSFRVDAIRGPAVWLRSRRVQVPDPSVSPEFTLEVMAEEVVDLLMAHLVMRFDPEQVKVRTVDRGDFLSSRSDPDHLLFFPSDVLEANSSGVLIVDMGVLQSNGSPAASGSGVLAQIRFSTLVGAQEAEVYFAPETKLVDARNEDMTLEAKIGAKIEIR